MKCFWPHYSDAVDRIRARQNEALHQSIREGAPVALKQLKEIYKLSEMIAASYTVTTRRRRAR